MKLGGISKCTRWVGKKTFDKIICEEVKRETCTESTITNEIMLIFSQIDKENQTTKEISAYY